MLTRQICFIFCELTSVNSACPTQRVLWARAAVYPCPDCTTPTSGIVQPTFPHSCHLGYIIFFTATNIKTIFKQRKRIIYLQTNLKNEGKLSRVSSAACSKPDVVTVAHLRVRTDIMPQGGHSKRVYVQNEKFGSLIYSPQWFLADNDVKLLNVYNK